jgi:hypothetical protein
MRVLLLLILVGACFLAGCGTYTPLEELEEKAMLSGDWSAVERRERIITERRVRAMRQCQRGYVSYCESRFGSKRCTCVQKEIISALVYGY